MKLSVLLLAVSAALVAAHGSDHGPEHGTTEPTRIASSTPPITGTAAPVNPTMPTPPTPPKQTPPKQTTACATLKAHTHVERCRTFSCILPTSVCDTVVTSVKQVTTTQTFTEGCEIHVQVGPTPCPTCPKCRSPM